MRTTVDENSEPVDPSGVLRKTGPPADANRDFGTAAYSIHVFVPAGGCEYVISVRRPTQSTCSHPPAEQLPSG